MINYERKHQAKACMTQSTASERVLSKQVIIISVSKAQPRESIRQRMDLNVLSIESKCDKADLALANLPQQHIFKNSPRERQRYLERERNKNMA